MEPSPLDLDVRAVQTVDELAEVLRRLRRRQARRRGDSPLTYRELAARTGWARAVIGDYFAARALPPTDRFDALVRLLGAGPHEQGPLASARDRVEESRRRRARAAWPGAAPGWDGRDRVDVGLALVDLGMAVLGTAGPSGAKAVERLRLALELDGPLHRHTGSVNGCGSPRCSGRRS